MRRAKQLLQCYCVLKDSWNNRGNGKYMQVQADVLVTVFSRF